MKTYRFFLRFFNEIKENIASHTLYLSHIAFCRRQRSCLRTAWAASGISTHKSRFTLQRVTKTSSNFCFALHVFSSFEKTKQTPKMVGMFPVLGRKLINEQNAGHVIVVQQPSVDYFAANNVRLFWFFPDQKKKNPVMYPPTYVLSKKKLFLPMK